jgi:hypothetical protein
VLAEKGVAFKAPGHTFLRNQAIEDDAQVHLSGTQAAGWETGLNMYNQREPQWRSQRKNVLAVRRWMISHINPKFSYCTRGVEDDRQAVRALRRAFPLEEEITLAEKAFDNVTKMAGATGLEASKWLWQWCLALDRHTRLQPA